MDLTSELAHFLRSRREHLRPEDVGLPLDLRPRRVPGLRREEVARLAGVSTDYYTRLEQGKHPHVSESVLTAVAQALRFDEIEKQHLFDLVRPRKDATGPDRSQRTRPEIHAMLEVLNDVSPALILNHRMDVLASNHLARVLLTDFDSLPYRDRNLARFVLLDPKARDLYLEWERVATVMVGNLRREAGRHPADALLNELIGEFCVRVPEFHAWWANHQVDQCAHETRRFAHPVVGTLTLRHEILAFPSDPDQALCLYTAESGSESAEILKLLASWTAEPVHVSGPTGHQR